MDNRETTSVASSPTPRATFLGMGAVVVWALMAGLVKLVSVGFGATLGTALLYTFAATALLIVRPPKLKTIPRRYLLIGGALFVSYESVFALAISMTTSSMQAVEVSLVNYLWPTLTVLFCAAASGKKGALGRVIPGAIIATIGVMVAVGGNAGFTAAQLAEHLGANPVPYLLTLIGAVIWALYSTVTPKISQGADATSLFFVGVATTLWIVFFVSGPYLPEQVPSAPAILALRGPRALHLGNLHLARRLAQPHLLGRHRGRLCGIAAQLARRIRH